MKKSSDVKKEGYWGQRAAFYLIKNFQDGQTFKSIYHLLINVRD